MTDPKTMRAGLVRGALAAIERRSLTAATSRNEFGDEERLTNFEATRTILPSCFDVGGIKTLLEIRISATYTIFRGDNDLIIEHAERNAMRGICRCLYEDILDELMLIVKAVGDGKRSDALEMLNALYVRLNGAE